jgi:hypothetical protein
MRRTSSPRGPKLNLSRTALATTIATRPPTRPAASSTPLGKDTLAGVAAMSAKANVRTVTFTNSTRV